MKKIRKWIYANRVTLSGLITLLIFFLDELFGCIGFKSLPDTLYYFIITLLYILLGYNIKGKGFLSIDQYEEIMKNKTNLGTKKSLSNFILYLIEILFKKPTKEDQPNLPENNTNKEQSVPERNEEEKIEEEKIEEEKKESE